MAIVGESSPFRKLPQALARRQVLFLDGIRYCAEMAELSHVRLRSTAAAITQASANGQQLNGPFYAAAFMDAWAIIDSTHRMRELVRQLPGLSKKKHSVEWRTFESSTAVVKDFRNKVQHLDQEINKVVEQDQPVWGMLTWFAALDENPATIMHCWLGAGTVFPMEAPAFTVGEPKELEPPVDHIKLHAHGLTLSLTDILKAIERMFKELERAFGEAFDRMPSGTETSGSDIFMSVGRGRGENQPPQESETPDAEDGAELG